MSGGSVGAFRGSSGLGDGPEVFGEDASAIRWSQSVLRCCIMVLPPGGPWLFLAGPAGKFRSFEASGDGPKEFCGDVRVRGWSYRMKCLRMVTESRNLCMAPVAFLFGLRVLWGSFSRFVWLPSLSPMVSCGCSV